MKRNILKYIITIALILIIAIGAIGCKKGHEQEERKATGYKLVNRGISEYSIVVSETADPMGQKAADELSFFLKAATGADLPIIPENALREGSPVISLGNTKLAQKNNLKSEGLGLSGYHIKTIGNSLFIIGGDMKDSAGVLYGVYDFLNDIIGFKVYAADEIYYEEKQNIPLYQYDDIVKPSFDERSLGYLSLESDPVYLLRMRLTGIQHSSRWGGIVGHNQAEYILPASTYQHEHPDWYNGAGTQLCWSAGEEMEREFAKNFIRYIELSSEATYFLIGQGDNMDYCNCERCQQAKRDYAMNAAGLQVVFANHVIEIVEQYLKENNIDRDIRYLIYAYQGTMPAPVVKNSNGEFVPFSEAVIPHEKLYIWFAPIGLDYSKPMEHQDNKSSYEALLSWKALLDGRIVMYSYDINFRNYFINWNNLTTLKNHYTTFANNGIFYMYSQGPLDAATPSFEEMRIFVEASLMWNIDQNLEDLVKEFIEHYYKEAAPYIYDYYKLIMNRYTTYQQLYGNLGGIYAPIGSSEIWTEPIVSAMSDCMDKALEAIKPLESQDKEKYEILKNRIMKQNLSVLFLKLSYYQAYYSDEEVAKMKSDFKYYTNLFNIEKHLEGGSLEGLFDN